MLKVKVRWGGFIGSPGWSNFYFDTGTGDFTTAEDAVTASDRVQAFFNAIKDRFPSTVNFQVQTDVEAIAPDNGELLTIHSGGSKPLLLSGTVAGPYSAATGAVVNWRTAAVRNGRRVRGRTFLVPLYGSLYDNDGTLASVAVTQINTAATALIGAASPIKMGVWARPTAPGASDGSWHPITTGTVPDQAAVLRSRRD